MNDDVSRAQLTALSRKLRDLHARIIATEQSFHPPAAGLALLDRLTNDPAWAWLRVLSGIIADIDHVLARDAPSANDAAVVAAHVRGMLAGEGDLHNAQFMERYRPLLQLDPDLVSLHAEVKSLLNGFPGEPENESERLHARHQWAMRCKHQMTG
jgi:hypothetical protein